MESIHLCECGCGTPTKIATKNDSSKGWIKGQPLRFLKGHNIAHCRSLNFPRKPVRRKPMESRFWAKVEKSPDDGCWIWHGTRSTAGYGYISCGGANAKHVPVHRYSWELAHGTIPDGLFVCHKCDNPPCVNPAHLFLGSHTENMQDMSKKGRGYYPRKDGGKTTAEDVREMRHLREQGWGLIAIAKRFGLATGTVSSICRRKTWKHVS